MQRKFRNIVLFIAEKAGYALFFPFYWIVKKRTVVSSQPTFLLSRLDHMGDVLMTTPAIKAIKQQYPDSKIYLLVNRTCSGVIECNPFIDAVFYYTWPWRSRKIKNKALFSPVMEYCKLYGQLRKLNADIFIEFRGDIRMFFLFGFLTGIPKRVATRRTLGTSFLTTAVAYNKEQHELERVVSILESINIPVANKRPEIYFSAEDAVAAKQITDKYLTATDAGYAIITPFSGKPLKEWVPERWASVADYLFKKYHLRSLIAGIKNDKTTAASIADLIDGCLFDITGDTNITQLAALMSSSKLVVGVDSGSLHLASCFDIPVIALFGPSNQQEFKPFSPYATIIDLNLCVCDKEKHDFCKKPKNGCSFCMDQISVDLVCDTIDTIAKGRNKFI